MEQVVLLELRVLQETNHLADELVHHGQVQRSKVVVVGLINQLLVYTEEVGILMGSRRPRTGDPVQAILNDLNVDVLQLLPLDLGAIFEPID